MTKKNYIEFATLLRAAILREEYKVSYDKAIFIILRDRMADIFKRDNKRFNRKQFYKAVGL